MAKKRQISAQTRVKLKQAAKKRRRGPKGTAYAGRFLDGLSASGARHHYALGGPSPGGDVPKGMGAKEYKENAMRPKKRIQGKTRQARVPYSSASSNELFTSHYNQKLREYTRAGMARDRAHSEAVEAATNYAFARTGLPVDLNLVEGLPTRVTTRGDDSEKKQAERILAGMVQPEDAPGIDPGKKTTKEKFREKYPNELTEFEDPNSQLRKQLSQGLVMAGSSQTGKTYNSPGERDRQTKYMRARNLGATRDQAIASALEDKRGRRVAGTVTTTDLEKAVKERRTRAGTRVKGANLAPRPNELTFGIDVPKVSSLTDLEKRWPGLSERDYVKLQQAERETIFDQFMKNRAWAHETRLAKMQGVGRMEGPDRVSVFTTSLGAPNVSVPSDSLVGQYVIKRRRRVAIESGLARASQMRGPFPEAVRDLHMIEVGTGTKLGAEGTAGLFHTTGWRVKSRKSKNYGKPVPVGASILRDNTGQPIYDAEGNIRYTEGATRPFSLGTNKDIGLRVFIG